MATPNISTDAQIRYIVQWFEEWSELQRQDFLPILAEKIAESGVYVNGVLNSLGSVNCQDKPMNLFQCRMKLFNEWYINWSQEDKDKLIQSITEIDENFGGKLQDEISGNKEVFNDIPPFEPESEKEQGQNRAESDELILVQNGPSEDEIETSENQEVVPSLVNENTLPVEIAAS